MSADKKNNKMKSAVLEDTTYIYGDYFGLLVIMTRKNGLIYRTKISPDNLEGMRVISIINLFSVIDDAFNNVNPDITIVQMDNVLVLTYNNKYFRDVLIIHLTQKNRADFHLLNYLFDQVEALRTANLLLSKEKNNKRNLAYRQ